MNITFKKDISKSYMVIEKVEQFSGHSFMMKMLVQNKIPGLLPVGYENLNGHYNILYDISSRQSFCKIYETEKLTFEQLKNLIFSLKGLLRTLDDYLLDANNIILKQECIFCDPRIQKFEYCYFPYYNGDLVLEIRELFTKMLSMVDYEDEKAVRLVYEMHSEVQMENFTIENILAVYYRIAGELLPKIQNVDPEDLSWTPERRAQIVRPETELRPEAKEEDPYEDDATFFERTRFYLKGKKVLEVLEDINSGEILEKIRKCGKAPSPRPAYEPSRILPLEKKPAFEYISLGGGLDDGFAEDNQYVTSSQKGTRLLGKEERTFHRLVGRKGQEGVRFEIRKLPFTIGKAEGSSDALLADPTVSRMHARLYEEAGIFYLEDLNSTNGTFLNEEPLPAYKKTAIGEGDILRFADEEFCFL